MILVIFLLSESPFLMKSDLKMLISHGNYKDIHLLFLSLFFCLIFMLCHVFIKCI